MASGTAAGLGGYFMKPVIHVGIDVGSTTVKVAALSPYLKLLFGRYQRHMSDIRSATMSLLKELQEKFSGYRITASISGSGGMGLAKLMGLPFCQEILAETKAVETFHPDTDVIIELGGEDEKITYLRNGVDQRMNGACAGGTGAFIDRMASSFLWMQQAWDSWPPRPAGFTPLLPAAAYLPKPISRPF